VIDTHAHLDSCGEAVAELLARARSAGVGRVVTIGSGLASCRVALGICEENAGVVFAALGIHPHQAGDVTREELAELRSLLEHPAAVGVGEAGLDYFRDYAPRPRQRELFEAQVTLAVELGKPLIVHSRAAEADTLAVLTVVPDETPVVLHCFGSPGLLPTAIERGYYVSFAGNVSYPKAEALRLAAARIAPDRLLAETDSPYLAPQRLRGRPNEPANVVDVLATLAAVRNEDKQRLESQIEANARAVFGLP
jgi:TatD DNase family protein